MQHPRTQLGAIVNLCQQLAAPQGAQRDRLSFGHPHEWREPTETEESQAEPGDALLARHQPHLHNPQPALLHPPPPVRVLPLPRKGRRQGVPRSIRAHESRILHTVQVCWVLSVLT